jgi:hypothetical protein
VIAPESAPRETASARLEALDVQVEAHLEASLAASTRAKYQRAWEQFTSWCAVHDLTALPATPRTLTRYVSDLAQTTRLVKGKPLPLTSSWIQLQLAAITLAQQADGIRPAPTQEIEVRLVMRGIRRRLGVAPRTEAAPLSVAQLREMVAATPEEPTQPP